MTVEMYHILMAAADVTDVPAVTELLKMGLGVQLYYIPPFYSL